MLSFLLGKETPGWEMRDLLLLAGSEHRHGCVPRPAGPRIPRGDAVAQTPLHLRGSGLSRGAPGREPPSARAISEQVRFRETHPCSRSRWQTQPRATAWPRQRRVRPYSLGLPSKDTQGHPGPGWVASPNTFCSYFAVTECS